MEDNEIIIFDWITPLKELAEEIKKAQEDG